MPNQIDLPRAAQLWTEVDRRLYNQLPIYLAKRQVEYIQYHDVWAKLLKPQSWTANMGNIMQGVNKVRSPIIRGQALPNVITVLPKKDIIEVRETSEQVQLYRQDFDSELFQFVPSFQDFLTDHIDATSDDINEKVQVYKDLFYRSAIFHGSPKAWICGKPTGTELTGLDYWRSPNIAFTKTQAMLQAIVAQTIGPLNLETIKKLGTVAYNDEAIVPFSGKVLPDGTDGAGLRQKYCLYLGTEVWDGFTDNNPDTYLLQNKALDLDIVTNGFTGSLFGRFTTKFERFELRIAADGTVPAPETTEENPAEYNYGDRVMNPLYVNAPVGVAFLVGSDPYKAVTIGAPPKYFADGSKGMSMTQFKGMDWNGKVSMTRDVLVPSPDGAGHVVMDTNKRGEYLQLIADLAMGILPNQRRNIIPIFYRRSRVAIP